MWSIFLKNRARERKHHPKSVEMTQRLHTNRIQKHTFTIFVKPSFWTILLWFCIDFTSPGMRTSMQMRTKSLPRRSITKLRRQNIPRSLFWRRTWKSTFKTPKAPQNLYKPSPRPPWDPKVAQAILESCPKAKKECSGHENCRQCSKKITMRAWQIFLRMQKRQDAQAKMALPLNRLQRIGSPSENKFKGRRHEASAI